MLKKTTVLGSHVAYKKLILKCKLDVHRRYSHFDSTGGYYG